MKEERKLDNTNSKPLLLIGTVFLITLTTLFFAEITTRFLLEAKIIIIKDYRSERMWEERYLKQYESGAFIYHGLHQSDPDLGWVLKPSIKVSKKGQVYTTNTQGFRALYDYKTDENKFTVVIVGDSFTFGDGITDSLVWPALLQANNSDLNVINLAVTAYGTDQMYLMLKYQIDHYKPDLVIVAFVDDNMRRAQLSFRDFKKPLFQLNDDTLELTNVPIGTFDEVYQEIKSKHNIDNNGKDLALIKVIKYIFRDESNKRGSYRNQLNKALFSQIRDVTENAGSKLLIVPLPEKKTTTKYNDENTG